MVQAMSLFAAKKIVKEKGADPEPFEIDVAQAFCDLEANSNVQRPQGARFFDVEKKYRSTEYKGTTILNKNVLSAIDW